MIFLESTDTGSSLSSVDVTLSEESREGGHARNEGSETGMTWAGWTEEEVT